MTKPEYIVFRLTRQEVEKLILLTEYRSDTRELGAYLKACIQEES